MESVERLAERVYQLGYPNYQIDHDGDITFLRSYSGDYAIEAGQVHLWTRFRFQFRADFSIEGTFHKPTDDLELKTDMAHKVARVWLLRKDAGLKVMVSPRIYPQSLNSPQASAHIEVTATDEEVAAENAHVNQNGFVVERSSAGQVTVAAGIAWDAIDESLDTIIDKVCYVAGSLFMVTSITGVLVKGEA